MYLHMLVCLYKTIAAFYSVSSSANGRKATQVMSGTRGKYMLRTIIFYTPYGQELRKPKDI